MFNQAETDNIIEAVVAGELDATGEPATEERAREFYDWCMNTAIASGLLHLVTQGLMDVCWHEDTQDWGFRLKEEGHQAAEHLIRGMGFDPENLTGDKVGAILNMMATGVDDDIPDEEKN